MNKRTLKEYLSIYEVNYVMIAFQIIEKCMVKWLFLFRVTSRKTCTNDPESLTTSNLLKNDKSFDKLAY